MYAAKHLNGDEDFVETPDYAEFRRRILTRSGIDLALYKPQQMYRRLYNLVERAGVRTFRNYWDLIADNPEAYRVFLDRLTINVSELFRNPEKWEELRTQILPPLLAKRQHLRVWSAGCSYGAEPYSLAILLDQLTPGTKHTIHATDLDRRILEKAREGRYTTADVKNLSAVTLQHYFQPTGAPKESGPQHDLVPCWQIRPEIRDRVRFRPHNLLADAFETDYDLICCRNVVIYFTEEAKERLFRRFTQSLNPAGGVLFVGGTERITHFQEMGLKTTVPFFYRRTTETR